MAEAPHVRARAFIESKDFAAAETILRQLVISQPTDGLAWQLLGTALFRKGDRAGASIAYRRALELVPNDYVSSYGLAIALKDLGQTEEALSLLRRTTQLKPDFTQATKRLSEWEATKRLSESGGTRPLPVPPVKPSAPQAPTEPVFAVAPPAGSFVGQARSIQKTREDDAWLAYSHPITWTFRVDRKDPDGNEMLPIPVRLTGGRIQGALIEGDWVAIPGPWKPGTTAIPRRITNLTTGAPIEVKGKGSRWLQKAILITFVLLFAVFSFFVVSNLISSDSDPPIRTGVQNGGGGNNKDGVEGGGGATVPVTDPPTETPTETEAPLPATIECMNTDGIDHIAISQGGTVEWTNVAGESMVLDLGEPQPPTFEPQTLDPGESFELAFPDAGKFSYACSYSATTQTGSVTVQ